MLYKTELEAEQVASREYGEVLKVGDHWLVKDILLDVGGVAEILGCSPRKVWDMREKGKLPATHNPTPGKVRWLLKDIIVLA